MTPAPHVELDDIRAAQRRIRGVAVRTPLVPGPETLGGGIYLKPESLQPIGAFKLRGAYNKMASLSSAEQARGVIAFSSGNHAQGVAYAARQLGIEATVVMPATAPEVKRARTVALGARVTTVSEGSEEDWRRVAEQMADDHGLTMVTPFDDAQIVAGQGTVGLEILEDLPDVDLVLVPIGGGGLISGVAAALRLAGSDAKIVGVEPEVANDAQGSLRSGRIVEIARERAGRTIADGMRATRIGDINFEHIRRFVDDIVVVSEAEIREAMRRLILEAHLVCEPSGAVALAAHLFRRDELPAACAAVAVVSGGNVESSLLAEILLEESDA